MEPKNYAETRQFATHSEAADYLKAIWEGQKSTFDEATIVCQFQGRSVRELTCKFDYKFHEKISPIDRKNIENLKPFLGLVDCIAGGALIGNKTEILVTSKSFTAQEMKDFTDEMRKLKLAICSSRGTK